MFRGKKLLRTAIPHDDESFIGYITRLTEINYYDTPSWILQMAELGHHVKYTSFVFNNSLSLIPLARLTGVDKPKLEKLIYHPVGPTRRKMGNYLLFGSAVKQYLIRPDRPKICPYCVLESGYTRRIWEIIPVTTCPIHKCLLIDECPNCHARISWNRTSICRCRCEFDWRECQSLEIEDPELVVTVQIYRLCNLIPAENKTRQAQIPSNPLYRLGLQGFLSALIFVASQYGRFIDTKGKFIVSLKRNVEIHHLLCRAFSTYNDWPENFFSFLDWRRAQMPNVRSANGLRRDFKEYKSVLYRQLSAKQFDFIRDAFETYLATRWDGGYWGRMKRLGRFDRMNTKYLPMGEAKKILGTPHVSKLVSSGLLNAIVLPGKRSLVLIERASLNELKRELERALSMKQVRNFLGLSSARITDLIKAKLLNPLREPSVDGPSVWSFSLTEAENLLKSFKDRIVSCSRAQSHRKLTLIEVLLKLDKFGVPFNIFVQSVLHGEISPCGMNKHKGLAKFLFLEELVAKFLKCKSLLDGEDVYSIADVARLLGTTPTAIIFLIRKGVIHGQKLSTSQYAGWLVKESDLKFFTSTFALARDVAYELGTNPGYLTGLLAANGIQPISDRMSDGGSLIIFKKSELKNIDLAGLVSLAKSEGRIILPSPFKNRAPTTFNEVEAANVLGIDLDAIPQLVERGVLTPHRYRRPSKGSADRYCFSLRTVTKWKRESVDCTSIVSFSFAARLLRMKPDNIYVKYVRTGRLKAVVCGKKRCENFFLLKDIASTVEQEEQILNAAEVATICRVNITCVYKWNISGQLKPISGPNVDGFGHNLYLVSDVERLNADRETFKAKRVSEGRSARFGRLPTANKRPVRNVVELRIIQLVNKWGAESQRKQISGKRVHNQLRKEGYQVGINTVYVCLRELRQRGIPLI